MVSCRNVTCPSLLHGTPDPQVWAWGHVDEVLEYTREGPLVLAGGTAGDLKANTSFKCPAHVDLWIFEVV